MGRWYRQGVECPVLAERDPDLLLLFHWLKATAKSLQLPEDAPRMFMANGHPVRLGSGQVLVFPRQMTKVLGSRFSRTKVTRLLGRLEVLGEVALDPIPRIGTVVRLAKWTEENPSWDQPGVWPGVRPGTTPGSGPLKSAQAITSPERPTTEPTKDQTRSDTRGVATNKNGNGNEGKEEEEAPTTVDSVDGGNGGGVSPTPLREPAIKAMLESEAQKVLGVLWFATEMWAVRQLLPVVREVGMDQVRDAWRAFMVSRKRDKRTRVRLTWFLDHINEHLQAVTTSPVEADGLMDHLQALVDEDTITTVEAWEIQNGAPWVDPNDILSHIAGRRKKTTQTQEVET